MSDELTDDLLRSAAGFLIGYLLTVFVLCLLDEWIVARELADRERIRLTILQMMEEERAKVKQHAET